MSAITKSISFPFFQRGNSSTSNHSKSINKKKRKEIDKLFKHYSKTYQDLSEEIQSCKVPKELCSTAISVYKLAEVLQQDLVSIEKKQHSKKCNPHLEGLTWSLFSAMQWPKRSVLCGLTKSIKCQFDSNQVLISDWLAKFGHYDEALSIVEKLEKETLQQKGTIKIAERMVQRGEYQKAEDLYHTLPRTDEFISYFGDPIYLHLQVLAKCGRLSKGEELSKEQKKVYCENQKELFEEYLSGMIDRNEFEPAKTWWMKVRKEGETDLDFMPVVKGLIKNNNIESALELAKIWSQYDESIIYLVLWLIPRALKNECQWSTIFAFAHLANRKKKWLYVDICLAMGLYGKGEEAINFIEDVCKDKYLKLYTKALIRAFETEGSFTQAFQLVDQLRLDAMWSTTWTVGEVSTVKCRFIESCLTCEKIDEALGVAKLIYSTSLRGSAFYKISLKLAAKGEVSKSNEIFQNYVFYEEEKTLSNKRLHALALIHLKRGDFKEAERLANNAKGGLWGKEFCLFDLTLKKIHMLAQSGDYASAIEIADSLSEHHRVRMQLKISTIALRTFEAS